MKRFIIGGATGLLASAAHGIEGPLAATTRGASCNATTGKMNCLYRFPDSTSFSIEWVGKDAVLYFTRIDDNGDYSVTFDTKFGCVEVNYGSRGREKFWKQLEVQSGPDADNLKKLAFVSPRTGRVYGDAYECQGD